MNEIVVRQKWPQWSKRVKITASITAGALALLGVGAAVAVPMMVHNAEVNEYHNLADQLSTTLESISDSRLQGDLVIVLGVHTTAEARSFQKSLTSLSNTKKPILTTVTTKKLGTAADNLANALGAEPKEGSDTEADDLVDRATKSLKTNNHEVKTWVGISAEELAELTGWVATPTKIDTVQEDAVNAAILDRTKVKITNAKSTLTSVVDRAEAAQAELDRVLAAVSATLPVLKIAANTTPTQAKAVIKKSGKAGKLKTETSTTAKAAHTVASAVTFVTNEDDGVVALVLKKKPERDQKLTEPSGVEIAVLLEGKIVEYVKTAKSAQKAHKMAVAKAKARAAAQARHVNPNIGNWVAAQRSSGGWGNGNRSPGSHSSGSGGKSGGSSSDGYVPKGGQCPTKPPGWYPSGSSANGCPLFSPPGGGGSDEW